MLPAADANGGPSLADTLQECRCQPTPRPASPHQVGQTQLPILMPTTQALQAAHPMPPFAEQLTATHALPASALDRPIGTTSSEAPPPWRTALQCRQYLQRGAGGAGTRAARHGLQACLSCLCQAGSWCSLEEAGRNGVVSSK